MVVTLSVCHELCHMYLKKSMLSLQWFSCLFWWRQMSHVHDAMLKWSTLSMCVLPWFVYLQTSTSVQTVPVWCKCGFHNACTWCGNPELVINSWSVSRGCQKLHALLWLCGRKGESWKSVVVCCQKCQEASCMIRAPEDKLMGMKESGKVWMYGQVSWMYGNEVVEMEREKKKEEQGHEKRGDCKRSAWLGWEKWGWGTDNRGDTVSDGTIDLVLLTVSTPPNLAAFFSLFFFLWCKSMKRCYYTPCWVTRCPCHL